MQGIEIGIPGIRVGTWEIGVGMRGIKGGNEGNYGENLCIGLELIN